MDKEEILAKSRKENSDEGMIVAENRGRKIGSGAFIAVCIFIILFNFFRGQNNDAPMAMFWAFIAAEAYPKYQFTKNKSYLITAVAGAVAAVVFLINFVLWH